MPVEKLSFLSFLQTFRRGSLLSEADDQLEELIRAVKDTSGKGELNIKLPFKMNDAGQLECQPVVSVKRPRRALGAGIFFATEDGALSQRDPDQEDFLDELEDRRSRSRADD